MSKPPKAKTMATAEVPSHGWSWEGGRRAGAAEMMESEAMEQVY